MKTRPASILQRMCSEIDADSRIFSSMLMPDARLGGPAPFSSLFAAACFPGLEGKDCTAGVSGAGLIQLGLEYIFEGYLLHYGSSRILDVSQSDGEFPVLAGDHMYARGLAAIAALKDLYCIRALAELIQVCAQIECERLEARQARDAWALTTLMLAAHVSGDKSSDEPGSPGEPSPASGAGGLRESGTRLETLLARYPSGWRGELQTMIAQLDEHFPQMRNTHATRDGERDHGA